MGKISCRRKEVVVKGNRGAAQGASPANLIDAKRPRGLTRDRRGPNIKIQKAGCMVISCAEVCARF